MTSFRTFLGTPDYSSMGPSHQAALTEILDRESQELHWLAHILLGSEDDVEKCIEEAAQHASGGAYVAPEWLSPWVKRLTVRAALERVGVEVHRIAYNSAYQLSNDLVPFSLNPSQKQIVLSIAAGAIGESCDAFERASLVLHGYLGLSIQDCALMLGCHRSKITPACNQAFHKILEAYSTTQIGFCDAQGRGTAGAGVVA